MALKTFHIGIKAVIVADDMVLLLQRQDRWNGLSWECPGGRMEDNANIEQTLRRELDEELPGIAQVTVGPLLHAGQTTQDWAGIGLMLLFYRVQATIPVVTVSDEHLAHTWATADDLDRLERGDGDGVILDYTLIAARAALNHRTTQPA